MSPDLICEAGHILFPYGTCEFFEMHGLSSVFLTFPLDFARTGDERAGRERGTGMPRQERASSRQVVLLLTSIISPVLLYPPRSNR